MCCAQFMAIAVFVNRVRIAMSGSHFCCSFVGCSRLEACIDRLLLECFMIHLWCCIIVIVVVVSRSLKCG